MSDEAKDTATALAPSEPAETASALPQDEQARLTDGIVAALKTVYDPEIPADHLRDRSDLQIDIEDDRMVRIEMTLTSPNCPSAAEICRVGGERGRQRARRRRGQGQRGVGSAVGPEPHERRRPA